MIKCSSKLYIGFLVLTVLVLNSLSAQNLILNGTIYDRETGLPLTGANVYLLNSNCGTVSGDDGQFRFHCKKVSGQDTLLINYLGYKEYRSLVQDFSNGSQIYLVPKSLDLGDEILIQAERIDLIKQDIPHAKNKIYFKEIERYGSSEISDILKSFSSVRIEGNDLDGRSVQIRGSDFDEVNIYLDGILLNEMSYDNTADLSIVPVESIQNLEVLKGGNSALLGSGAFGGVISVNTKQKTQPTFFIKGKWGSFENRYLVQNISVPLTNKLFVNYFGQLSGFSPAINFFQTERFSSKTAANSISVNKQSHNLGLNYFTSAGKYSFRFLGYFLDYDKPLSHSSYNRYLSAVSYQGEIFGSPDFDVIFNHLYNSDEIKRDPGGNTKYINSYDGNRFNLRLTKKFAIKDNGIQLLAEYFHDDLKTDSKIKDLDRSEDFYHSFIYDNRLSLASVASFNDYLESYPVLSWETFIGLRGDFLASGYQDFLPTVGAKLNLELEKWKLSMHLNYGKNAKYPTLQENADINDVTKFSNTNNTLQRLEPEYSNSAELGFNSRFYPVNSFFKSLDFSFAIFTRSVFNKLLTMPFLDVIATTQIGRNVTRGVESSLQLKNLFNDFGMNLSYIKLDISQPLLYSYKPDQNLSLSLNYNAPLGFYFLSTFFYEGKSVAWFYDDQFNVVTDEIAPFNDIDVVIGIDLPVRNSEVSLQFSGYNILDNSGYRFYHLNKQNFQVSLAFKY